MITPLPPVDCTQLFTVAEIQSLQTQVDSCRKNLDAQSKRNFRQSERHHLQVRKTSIVKRAENLVSLTVSCPRWKYRYLLQDVEESMFELIETETRQNLLWIQFWQKELLTLVSNSSKKDGFLNNISKVIENCLFNNNRTNEQLRHDLHSLIFDYLLSKDRKINSNYCECGSTKQHDFIEVQGPKRHPESAKDLTLRFVFQNHAEVRDLKAVQNNIREMIYYISWKNLNVNGFTIRKVISLKNFIEKKNESNQEISYSYELSKLKIPAAQALKKLDWEDVKEQVNIDRPPEISDAQWLVYLEKWNCYGKESFCLCTCDVCDWKNTQLMTTIDWSMPVQRPRKCRLSCKTHDNNWRWKPDRKWYKTDGKIDLWHSYSMFYHYQDM